VIEQSCSNEPLGSTDSCIKHKKINQYTFEYIYYIYIFLEEKIIKGKEGMENILDSKYL